MIRNQPTRSLIHPASQPNLPAPFPGHNPGSHKTSPDPPPQAPHIFSRLHIHTHLSPLFTQPKRRRWSNGGVITCPPFRQRSYDPAEVEHVTKWFERQFDPGVRVWERTKSSVAWTLAVGEIVFVVWGGWLIVGSIPNCAVESFFYGLFEGHDVTWDFACCGAWL